MKKSIFILNLLIILLSCKSRSNENNNSTIIEKGLDQEFEMKFFNFGVKIQLRPDFTFSNINYSRGCTGGFYIKEVIGAYSVVGKHVSFFPENIIIQCDYEDSEFNEETTQVDSIGYYYVSDSTKIQTKYRILEYGDLKFLISSSSYYEYDDCYFGNSNYIALANIYNTNDTIKSGAKLLSSSKDVIVNFSNLNIEEEIPTRWKDYFLKAPIEVHITSIKVHKVPIIMDLYQQQDTAYNYSSYYSIDLGYKNGIREGMHLYTKNKKYGKLTVHRVNENDAVTLSDEIFPGTKKIGTLLSTLK